VVGSWKKVLKNGAPGPQTDVSHSDGDGMTGITILVLLIGVLVGLGIVEYSLHRRNLRAIPIRIHVNGTRGKSSVTRLIAAGLRAGGITTIAKTTGTLPRVIVDDGTEYPVFRQSRPNIIEQLRIVAFAARNRARALVIECMALQPHLQSLSEQKMIRATHGVITNVREDHLDVMGPTERDVALAILGTTPNDAVLFTAEQDYPDEFAAVCAQRNTRCVFVGEDAVRALEASDMARFSYLEHPENVALALSVCEAIGVERDVALAGMQSVAPDPGAMSDLRMNFFGRDICFINGFAANDPESFERIWRMALKSHSAAKGRIMVINTRIDRPDRSRQFGEALASWPAADKYVLIGSGSYFLVKYAVRSGIDPRVFVNAEGLDAESIFEEILSHCRESTLVMGVGNIAGPGLELIKYFKNRSTVMAYGGAAEG